jgi:hypothetical protein
MRIIILLAVFVCIGYKLSAQILPSFGNSRTGGSGMQFLKISPDARGLSMGGAVVAVANDPSAMYWNPAAISGADTARVIVMGAHTRYFGDISGNFAGVVFRSGKLSHIGVQAFSMNYGTMDETTEFESKGTGRTFNVSNTVLGITYAKILTNSFSFGINGKFANEAFAGMSINNVLFDLGLKYDVGVKHARFGINFSNFGFNVNPNGDVQVLKFNGNNNINSFSRVTVPGLFRVGLAFDPLHLTDHVITVSSQLNHPTDNNETYAVGMEYGYLKTAYLRAGYEFGSDERFNAPAAGVGLNILRAFGGFRIDYGYLALNRLGANHRIALLISIR